MGDHHEWSRILAKERRKRLDADAEVGRLGEENERLSRLLDERNNVLTPVKLFLEGLADLRAYKAADVVALLERIDALEKAS